MQGLLEKCMRFKCLEQKSFLKRFLFEGMIRGIIDFLSWRYFNQEKKKKEDLVQKRKIIEFRG